MGERQKRIIEDLSGVFSGEIRCDELAVSMYATDGSIFQIRPVGVAFPRNRDDVITLARYASETDLPLIPRGAGTNVNGAVLGEGLIVDFSRHMHAIEQINDATITVQAGVVLERLNRELHKSGRYFPPDPSTAAITTIGGMLGVDAAGSRAVRVGSTRDHVVSIDVVVPGGHFFECGIEPLNGAHRPAINTEPGDDTERVSGEVVKQTIVSKLGGVLEEHHALIQRHQPPLVRNTSGYYLRGVCHGRKLQLARLLVGSEGTLGLFTAATLHTAPLPEHRGVILLLFGQMEQAIDAVQIVTQQQPSACDLLDRRLLMLGRENDSRFASIIPPTAEAGLLIEQTGFSRQQTQNRISMAISAVQERFHDLVIALEAYDFDDVEFLWELPRKVVPLLTRIKGHTRPVPFIEDVALPPEALKEFFVRSQRTLQKHEVTASLYSHAASGQVHMRPFVSFPRNVNGARLAALSREIYEVALALGGTVSGEHGDGLSRSIYVRQQYGPLYPVLRQVKAIFDPQNLLNPGKIITHDSDFPVHRLRPATKTESELVQLQLNWKASDVAQATECCNGCGLCRSQQDELRMCPFFRLDPSEEASPRSKANAVRALLNGELPRTVASSTEMEHLASLCFNCKQCDLECPTNTPISELMVEMKAQLVEANGLNRATWALSRAHSYGDVACRFSWVVNLLLRSRVARWVIEKTFGIHRHRKLPLFAHKPFLSAFGGAEVNGGARRQNSIVYFVDHFANYHDVDLARAFLSIMQHHGVHVHVPAEQTGSGMAMVSAGDLAAARHVAETNLRQLVEFARDDLPIVCTEPAAALCLRNEYPLLLDNPDTQVVARQVVEAGAFLKRLHESGQLRTDFEELPIRVGYHTPCHLKALQTGSPLFDLLQLVPGIELVSLEAGCSGMAGAYGMTKENFQQSLKMGRPLLDRMRHPNFVVGATECSSCRMQMEHDSPVPTIHPIKILAAAYGLQPKLRDRLLGRRKGKW